MKLVFKWGFLFILVATASTSTGEAMATRHSKANAIVAADLESATQIVVSLAESLATTKRPAEIRLHPAGRITAVQGKGKRLILTSTPLDYRKNYEVEIVGLGRKPLRPMGILDSLYSEKPLGCHFRGERTVFRVFAPRATKVELDLFRSYEQEQGERHAMQRDADGVWEASVPRKRLGMYYGYRVSGPAGAGEIFDPSRLIADPYSAAVATENHYLHKGKTLIFAADYDWQGDHFVAPDWRDLIILEAHMRDLTAHPTAGVDSSLRGSYRGFLDAHTPGGLNYLKDLGVNAVEFLPVQDFGNLEVPYKDASAPVFNTWNPYARNHWGYMTSYFFAPESYYASGASMRPGEVSGQDSRAVREMKDVVRALHRNGIAVILDVVYNHVAQYDQNCFKYLDKKYYFRLDGDLKFLAKSGCGNDFKSERPMARRLIVDSVLHWMREYHVDGFRFDIAAMLDWETIDAITEAARKINPDVILIAEPWGGGKYEPAGFSKHGWAAWNDQFRNGIKGQNPRDGLGFIFGKWQGKNNTKSLKNYVLGTLAERGGLFQKKAHAVNYLESHDDYTLGDFIRIGCGAVAADQVIADVDANARLDKVQLRLNRLAALVLLTSQGPVMLAQGQDWGRSKVIAPTEVPDPNVGRIDHNSYEKDNATNWLNWQHREMNADLVAYYRGLIALRKAHPAFRRAGKRDIRFLRSESPFALGYLLKKGNSGDRYDFVVLLNGNPQFPAIFALPAGNWEVIVDAQRAGTRGLITAHGGMNIVVPPTSGMVFRKILAK